VHTKTADRMHDLELWITVSYLLYISHLNKSNTQLVYAFLWIKMYRIFLCLLWPRPTAWPSHHNPEMLRIYLPYLWRYTSDESSAGIYTSFWRYNGNWFKTRFEKCTI